MCSIESSFLLGLYLYHSYVTTLKLIILNFLFLSEFFMFLINSILTSLKEKKNINKVHLQGYERQEISVKIYLLATNYSFFSRTTNFS